VIDTARDVIRLDAPAKVSASVMQNGQWTHVGSVTVPAGWFAGPGPLE
jgi:hypothetical protein